MAALERVPGKFVAVHVSYRSRAAERGTMPARGPTSSSRPLRWRTAASRWPGDLILTGTRTGSTVVQPGDVLEVEVSQAFADGPWLGLAARERACILTSIADAIEARAPARLHRGAATAGTTR